MEVLGADDVLLVTCDWEGGSEDWGDEGVRGEVSVTGEDGSCEGGDVFSSSSSEKVYSGSTLTTLGAREDTLINGLYNCQSDKLTRDVEEEDEKSCSHESRNSKHSSRNLHLPYRPSTAHPAC